MREIYLDHAATSPMSARAREAMRPYMEEMYGNPSGVYKMANRAAMAIERAKDVIAQSLGAAPEEIFFTSGGTEANNWALIAAFDSFSEKGRHIVTTKIEHESILNTCEYLERVRGAEITYLDVDEKGFVSPEAVAEAVRPDTVLVSVMTANNEVGTIEDVAAIGRVVHAAGSLFHTDAVQAYGKIPLQVDEMEIDLLSASGHKIHGPKGVGFLYIRNGVRLKSFIHGGAQQRGRRAGTENVAGIVGMAEAAAEMQERMEADGKEETALRDHMIRRIETEIEGATLNGDRIRRLPNNVNFSFDMVDGETVIIALDMRGICVSAGSACSSGSVEPSHVLLALGRSFPQARGAIRMTIGRETTREDADYAVDQLKEIIQENRILLN